MKKMSRIYAGYGVSQTPSSKNIERRYVYETIHFLFDHNIMRTSFMASHNKHHIADYINYPACSISYLHVFITVWLPL